MISFLQATPKPSNVDCPELPSGTNRDDGNGCQGCGGLYADNHVLIVDNVGPVCKNCVHNLIAWSLEGIN